MSAIVNALDNYTTTQIGANGHTEYTWSHDVQEQILQFSFQLTRTKDVKPLKLKLTELLKTLSYNISNKSLLEKELARDNLSVLYKMIGHTRDIIDGKGEYQLTYMMIHTWYDFYPELSLFALKCLVNLEDNKVHQYGSWKDIKYFCKYGVEKEFDSISHPLIEYAVKLINTQLRIDHVNYISNSTDISLAAKWAPREKSQYFWLYQALATDYYKEFLATAITPLQKTKAILKCKTEYRKLLSVLNKEIDTLQIKQCGRIWSSIDFNNVTSVSLSKQKKAFLNIKKTGETRFPENIDRTECAEHFDAHIKKAVKGEIEMKGKRIGMEDFTKQAIMCFDSNTTQPEIDLLNSQWRDNSTQNGSLGKMIAMVDVSGSMNGDPMNAAIALGIRIAENSTIGKRVMTFSAKPSWVNLDPYPDFVSQVKVVKSADWGMNTDFHAALDLILNAIVRTKMSAEDVQDMVLVILSDMQMDSGDACDKKVLYDIMKTKYAAAGIQVNGTPYNPPHILFWNLQSATGFPSLSTQPNTSMMSGFSPALLNTFCELGLDALKSCSPWCLLVKSLENERYTIMANKLSQEL